MGNFFCQRGAEEGLPKLANNCVVVVEQNEEFLKFDFRSLSEEIFFQLISSSPNLTLEEEAGIRKGLMCLENRLYVFSFSISSFEDSRENYEIEEIKYIMDSLIKTLPRMEKLVTFNFMFSKSQTLLRFVGHEIMILNCAFSRYRSDSLRTYLKPVMDKNQISWENTIRDLGHGIRRKSYPVMRQGDSNLPTAGSLSTLLLETTKMELLVKSLPDIASSSKAITAAVKIIGGVVMLPYSLTAGWNILRGAVDATNIAISYSLSVVAKRVSDIFVEFDKLVIEVSYKVSRGGVTEAYIQSIKDTVLGWQRTLLRGKNGEELKSQRWEIYAAFVTMLTDLIFRLSPVTYLRNKFLIQVNHCFQFEVCSGK